MMLMQINLQNQKKGVTTCYGCIFLTRIQSPSRLKLVFEPVDRNNTFMMDEGACKPPDREGYEIKQFKNSVTRRFLAEPGSNDVYIRCY